MTARQTRGQEQIVNAQFPAIPISCCGKDALYRLIVTHKAFKHGRRKAS